MKNINIAEAEDIQIERILVPLAYKGKSNKVEDDLLKNSVELTGIQQPLLVSRTQNDRFLLIDGARRLRVAEFLKLKSVPCVIDSIPPDVDPELYRNRVRFILDEHRQDLVPSQRATLINKLQQMFSMTRNDVAAYLGVTSGTISNWLLPDKLIPEARKAIDENVLTVHTARAFAGMSKEGQERVWSEHRDYIVNEQPSAATFHRFVRTEYAPLKNREMYKNPELLARKLERGEPQKRVGKKRVSIAPNARTTLARDVDAKRAELDDKQVRVRELQQEIESAIPLIMAIRENEEIWDVLPADVQSDFKEFLNRFGDADA